MTTQTRALLAIECLSYLFEEGGINAKEFSSDIYCIAHAASGKCGNPHENWLAKIKEIEETGKKLGIYDIEKIMSVSGESWDG